MRFPYHEGEIAGLAIDGIPAISSELVVDLIDESLRAIKTDLFFAADQHPQHPIKTEEMIDMRMRDKHVLEAPDFSRRQ